MIGDRYDWDEDTGLQYLEGRGKLIEDKDC